jgi:acyl carrier protein
MSEVEKIEAELLGFLHREVFAPSMVVTAETDLVAAGLDSMALVRMLLFIEMTHGLWIHEKEITTESLRNVRTLAATVARLLHER